ncbi:hypothetical protein [Streptococcus pneumoniae]|uniref:hypothetical protein n=1 Tax=Streptococcus pneumoniae TaxID=1313 RepID=UPI0015DAE089|nr:hypothetical protein [Streptococcus pneumoniae]
MKIKEQTRQTSRRIVDTSDAVSSKLAVGCSKHCFEVVIHLTQSVTYLRQGDVDAV